jgi:AraC family transcriptional regulator, regulatory protein of adaptative response / methylated-DNA-[protein]-cysteine methyltransferase
MVTWTSNANRAEHRAADVLIPVIRTAATIGFAIAPCSLGFVIIAVSEHLIRSIMVGDDPEMLVSDLQNQFPNEALEVMEHDPAGLVPQVVDLIKHPSRALELPCDAGGIRSHVLNALRQMPPGALSREDSSYAK